MHNRFIERCSAAGMPGEARGMLTEPLLQEGAHRPLYRLGSAPQGPKRVALDDDLLSSVSCRQSELPFVVLVDVHVQAACLRCLPVKGPSSVRYANAEFSNVTYFLLHHACL